MTHILKTLSVILLLVTIETTSVHASSSEPQTIADAMALVLAQDDLAETSLERLEGTYADERRRWTFHLREGGKIHSVVVRSDGRLSKSMRADERTEREAEYWTGMPPAAQTVADFLSEAVIADARVRVEDMSVALTGVYLLRYTARRPNQGERMAMHTVEVIFELAGEERRGKRVVYRDGRFQELTDITLFRITTPTIGQPNIRQPRIEAPEIAVPGPRFPEQKYPLIDVPGLSGPGVRVQEGDDLAIITLDGAILFNFDKSDLRPDAQATLSQILDRLTSHYPGAHVEIHGHTDAMGTDEYNQGLSERRAESVRSWFGAQGIAAHQLRAVGLGESMPVAPNVYPDGSDNPEGRQKNRRVEVIIHKASS